MNKHEYWEEIEYWKEREGRQREANEILRAELRLWQARYDALIKKVAEGTALIPAPRLICCADCPSLKVLDAEKLK